jgi:methylmalonyl-CoA mutase
MAVPMRNLFEEFELPDPSKWSAVATTELGGKDPQQILTWEVTDLQGFAYYDTASVRNTLSLPLNSSSVWQNIPMLTITNETENNRIALTHLNAGADGILFCIPHDRTVLLKKLFEKIEWPHCNISFLTNTPALDLSDELKKFAFETNLRQDELTGSLFTKTYPHHPQSVNKLIHNLENWHNFKCFGIYSGLSNPIESIATALCDGATLVEQLSILGTPPRISIPRFAFAMEIGTDFFIEAAKVKALRYLWYQVAQAYEATGYQIDSITIHAISPPWINEAYEPHGNMLKSTTAAMAAIIGGCNALSICPQKETDTRIARIARNVSLLLKEESRFDKVADPLAGSYYLDCLTDQLIRKAWALFKNNITQS